MPVTQEEEEAMDALAKLGGGVTLGEMFTQMGKDLANHELAHQQAQQNLLSTPPHPFKDAFKVEPVSKEEWMQQATGTNVPTLESVLQSIAQQFSLLSTVIKGNSLNAEDQSKSLQECVSLTLQQADWFKEMVRGIVDDTYDFADYAESAVESVVEKEVESYFSNQFDPEDHFDFGDAVENAVDDRIDDVVRDRVMDSLDEVVAEKLSEATIKVEF